MKLGKGSVLAIFESTLFLTGAVFFLLVLMIPSNPIWALIAGIICGLAGAMIWSCSFFVRIGHNIHSRVKSTKINPADVAKKILENDDFSEDNYELHRTEAYDNYEFDTDQSKE